VRAQGDSNLQDQGVLPLFGRKAVLSGRERERGVPIEIHQQKGSGEMSKHTVTMKSLIDENAQLRIHAHKLEVEIAGYKARSATSQKLWNDWGFTTGMALGWLLGWGFNSLMLLK